MASATSKGRIGLLGLIQSAVVCSVEGTYGKYVELWDKDRLLVSIIILL
jgi:hypothetical protein